MKVISVEEFIKKINNELNHKKIIDKAEKKETVIKIDKKEDFFSKNVYEYPEFMKFYDEQFVVYVYKALLRRMPDENGLKHYLKLLRSGKKSKTEIISIIRYSKEGKLKNIKLLGSKKRYFYTILSSFPVLGYFIKTLNFFIRIPTYMERYNRLENEFGVTKHELEKIKNIFKEIEKNL